MVVREFRVGQGCERDFEVVFGTDGVWAELVRSRSQGYIATELLAIDATQRRYAVRDLWRSHVSFEVFRDWYQSDIEKFRDWLTAKDLVEQEAFLGAFYFEEKDDGDDAGLVSA